MVVLDLLPAWVPTEPLLLSLVAFIVLILLMNRGDMWVLNVLAQDEPLLIAIGIFVFLGAGWLSSSVGIPVLWFQVIGASVALAGVVIFRSDRWDISGLI